MARTGDKSEGLLDQPTRRHLLVTNDFPPKIGGIQNYLWELWRRLPPETTHVYTTPYPEAARFDAEQPFGVTRSPEPVLLPYPWLPNRIRSLARRTETDLVVIDPALPLGAFGPMLGVPYAVVLHGAEMTIPGRVPALSQLMAKVLKDASLVVAAGQYPLTEANRCAGRELPSVVVPPGVDTTRFVPPSQQRKARLRAELGLGHDDVLLATVSRLVPRKGMETLIEAAAEVQRRRAGRGPRLDVRIGGTGRQEPQLRRLIERSGAPVRLLGRLADDEVVDLYGAADLMAMLCNERWFGLEQEGFGIVFLEAAACGVPQIGGRSGGAHEAVEDGVSGLVIDEPRNVALVADAIEKMLDEPELRVKMGAAGRQRVMAEFSYDHLAQRLHRSLQDVVLT